MHNESPYVQIAHVCVSRGQGGADEDEAAKEFHDL